ncbi:MAG: hypothetical protein A4E57_00934 [Syntrophorhabdaceae bacterium PtaU1.Bin034]|nr:MAG: hypothetical protein A4E57_00934 [Syntrophorhabdaceae bacterium PtaU1.Bin034]
MHQKTGTEQIADSRIYEQIAQEYGVATVAVARIKQRRSWVGGVEYA